MSEFERAMWELVRIWLNASYAAIKQFGQHYTFVYAWSQICTALGSGYMGRELTGFEAETVWNALIDAEFPGFEDVARVPDEMLRWLGE